MKRLKPILLSVSVIIMSFVASFVFASWIEPTLAPPNGNALAPVNVSGTGQTKAGALTIQGILTASSGIYTSVLYDDQDSNYYVNPAGQTILAGNVGIGTAMNPNNTIQVKDLINFPNSDYGTFLGYQAGNVNTGDYNTFVGYQAGLRNVSGIYNTAIGSNSLLNTISSYNTAVGYASLESNISGQCNTAVGTNSLWQNIDGYANTAVGNQSLVSNTSGGNNVAFGDGSLYKNTEGGGNTALGRASLQANMIGNSNTAVGEGSLLNTISSYNTAVGDSSLRYNISGESNTAMGINSMDRNLYGSFNSVIGRDSLYNNTTGNFNTANGSKSLYNATGSGNVALGYYAGYYETDSNTFYVDNQDRYSTAGDKAGSLLYGTFNATPASQTLKINAGLTVSTLAGTGSRTVLASAAGLLSAPTSDARLKTNIIPIGEDKAMAMLKDPAIFGINYNWKDPNRGADTELGFTAQMFESYKISGLTFEDNGIKGLNYDKLTTVLWEQNKAQEKEINNLINRVEALEVELQKFKP